MSYLALYRKYRPTTFDGVIDQEHITNTLINQIKSDKIGHAYLFCGSRGTGKTSTAKIFARAINCLNPVNGSPCGKCENCKNSLENNFDCLEIDAASNNGVDEVRELREQVKYPPVNAKYKVYIIDEVHMLTASAFNALLKTLEEPPKYVVFILATTEVHKIPATILSRCMRFDFKLVSTDKICELIKDILKDQNIEFEDKAVQLIARAGEGSVRDALSLADMVIAYAGAKLTYDSVVKVIGATEKEKLFEIVDSFLKKDIGECLYKLDRILSMGKPPLVLSKELISYFRDLLIIITIKDKAPTMVVAQKDVYEKMELQANAENYPKVIRAIQELSTVEQELRFSSEPKIVLETAIIKALTTLSLEERVDALEKKLQASLEDKKKISPNIIPEVNNISKTVNNNAEKVYGKLLKQLRLTSEMQLYSAIINLKSLKLENNCLTIEIKGDNLSKSIDYKNNNVLNRFFKDNNLQFNIVLIEDEEEQLIQKLQKIIGDKLVIN